MSFTNYTIQNNAECQDVFYNVFMPEDPFDDSQEIVICSEKKYTDFCCPKCGQKMYSYEPFSTYLKSFPAYPEHTRIIRFEGHRFRCSCCHATITEPTPFKYPGTRITMRASLWIETLLRNGIPANAIAKMSGIHWSTIRYVHKQLMDESLDKYEMELELTSYRPRFLAIDEFAIHKGHTYATCVMDLATGYILWVGRGRAIADFEHFFKEYDQTKLTEVKAVAMDMNASYNKLVQEHLPQAKVVYDRYHMQAQFGKEVLGVVRLDEARMHRDKARDMQEALKDASNEDKPVLKERISEEKKNYRTLKKVRWPLLTNEDKLNPKGKEALQDIFAEHEDLAICYSMKEEMIALYELRDYDKALAGWKRWFEAALGSGIPALVRFAKIKLPRIDGLVNHALYPINTGKLEGFNNKIKVAKRRAYGYRDDEYFFTLIRYLSIPTVRGILPKKP
ncbi:MAG: ISL3 family transposase [Acidaminococcus sp.]|nr:ISL3 family transposase [Acidaminococcus sp.]